MPWPKGAATVLRNQASDNATYRMLASNSPKIQLIEEVKSTLKTQYDDVCFNKHLPLLQQNWADM